ncbi:MAG TPA: tyrosine-type recombinase/integrase [Pseudonocardiaceae bacterium]|nr:tyrosine-type recombinase/integrase [Pseudonocardiaceae bacterium]
MAPGELESRRRHQHCDAEPGHQQAGSANPRPAGIADPEPAEQSGQQPQSEQRARGVPDGELVAPEQLSSRSLRLIHQILERAIPQAQARDKVRRNVASLITVPEGKEGHPSKAMTLDQAIRLLEALETETDLWLAAYVVLSPVTGIRTEEARALTWAELDLQAGTVAMYRAVRTTGDTKTRKSRRLLKLPTKAIHTLRTHHTHQTAQRHEAADTAG